MSLSTDFHAIKTKSANAFETAGENHPVLVSLASLIAVVSALIMLTRLLLH